jgi:hypothetical protein
MKGYVKVVEDAEIFENISDMVAYLWVSDEPRSFQILHGLISFVGPDGIHPHGE